MTKGEKKRQEIQGETIRLIKEKGYENVLITEIAKNIGLSIGGMYHHYQSKDKIIIDIINNQKLLNITTVMAGTIESDTKEAKLSRLIQRIKHDLLQADFSYIKIAYTYYFSIDEASRQVQLARKYDEVFQFMNQYFKNNIREKKEREQLINNFICITLGLHTMSLTNNLTELMIDNAYRLILLD